MTSRRINAYAIILVAGILIGGIAVAAYNSERERTDPLGPPEVAYQPIGQAKDALQQQAKLTVWTQAREPLRLGQLEGTATRIFVQAGDAVRSGDPVLAVDEVVIIAVEAEIPFYRDIAIGDVGADVNALKEMLSGQGYTTSSGSTRWEWRDRQAARELLEGLGVPKTLGQASTLPTQFFVWIPSTLEVGALRAQVSDQLSSDDLVADGRVLVQDAVISEPLSIEFGKYVFMQQGNRELLDLDSDGSLKNLESALLVLSQEELADGLASDGTEVEGSIQLVDPVTQWTLPLSAIVFDDQSASACVVIRAQASDETWVQNVEVSAGGLDAVSVEPFGEDSSILEVLSNPQSAQSALGTPQITCDAQ